MPTTSPLWNWLEQALVWDPTLSPAWVKCDPAAPGDCPSTLGTETSLCVPETVSTTVAFCLTLAPPAGVCEITVPTGLGLVMPLTE